MICFTRLPLPYFLAASFAFPAIASSYNTLPQSPITGTGVMVWPALKALKKAYRGLAFGKVPGFWASLPIVVSNTTLASMGICQRFQQLSLIVKLTVVVVVRKQMLDVF